MLKAEQVSYRIGKKKILENMSAEFGPGDFNIILGPNGSGKSSFLKILSGETARFEGMVFYDEQVSKKIKKHELAKVRGFMSQQPDLSFPLMVEEVVMMGRYPHFNYQPGKADIQICNEAIQKMNLESFRERNYLTLSGGEKQRVQFARVLAQIWQTPEKGNRYLFLDEPVASLDIYYQHQFLQLAKEMAASGMVVIAVLHDINLAIEYGDRVLFLKDGTIAGMGKPAEIITADLIMEVFNIPVRIMDGLSENKPIVAHDNI